jgi:toxin ParE1/3/4
VTTKPVVLRKRAAQDTDEAIAYYLREADVNVAFAFVAALERAYGQIARHPTSGSLRYAHELDLPGLRYRTLRRFPYLVFYVDRTDRIDVWRVLHGERDISDWLRKESP